MRDSSLQILVYCWLFFSVYVNTWLPGSLVILSYVNIIYISIFFVFLITEFDFTFMNMQISVFFKKHFIIFLIILAFAVSTFLYNSQEITKIKYLINIMSLICSILFYFSILPIYYLHNKKRLFQLINVLTGTSFIVSLIGFIIMILNLHPSDYPFTTASLFSHPNYAPPLYIIGLICSIYLYDNEKYNICFSRKFYLLSSITINILAILFTFSRNGIVAMMLGLLIYSIMKFRFKILFILPVATIIILAFVQSFILSKGTSSVISRYYLLVPAYVMITESSTRFLWGYGFSNNYEVYEKYKHVYNIMEQNIQNPHNSYVSLVMMFGIIVSILTILFILFTLIQGILLFKSEKNSGKKQLISFYITMVFSMLCLGIFESQLLMPHFMNFQLLVLFSGILYHFRFYRLYNNLNKL